MAAQLAVRLLTPARALAEAPAEMLVAPAAGGQISILPGHTPYLSDLAPGVVELRQGGVSDAYFVTGGCIEVEADRAVVLAEAAEPVAGIDVARAQADLRDAEQALRDGDVLDADQEAREARAERARQRLVAARFGAAA